MTTVEDFRFRRALKECQRWNVPVIEVAPTPVAARSREDYFIGLPDYSVCIDAEWGVIVWADEDRGGLQAAALIHEMAHVVVWRELGTDPEHVDDELEFMLAIEHEACRRIEASWHGWMKDYAIPPALVEEVGGHASEHSHDNWGGMSTLQRRRLLERSYLNATRVGLMKGGKPTYKCTHWIEGGKRHRFQKRSASAAA